MDPIVYSLVYITRPSLNSEEWLFLEGRGEGAQTGRLFPFGIFAEFTVA